jgi:hypothetical protein
VQLNYASNIMKVNCKGDLVFWIYFNRHLVQIKYIISENEGGSCH